VEFVLIDTADEAHSWKTVGHPNTDSLLLLIRTQGYSLKEQQSGIYLFSKGAERLSFCNHSS
jgi:lipocalin